MVKPIGVTRSFRTISHAPTEAPFDGIGLMLPIELPELPARSVLWPDNGIKVRTALHAHVGRVVFEPLIRRPDGEVSKNDGFGQRPRIVGNVRFGRLAAFDRNDELF